MGKTIEEPGRSIPVLEEADVVVVGGGVAGCAAACAAGTAGAKTILLERNGCLGGVATASLMANIGNRFLVSTGEQVIHGFAGRLVDRLVDAGAAPPKWQSREIPGVVIDSERLKVVLIEMLEEAGVTTLTHALGARPIMAGSTVRGVFVESKSGRQAILAKGTVDATGEADIAWQAGADVEFGRGSASTLFKLANVDLDAFAEFLAKDADGFPDWKDGVKDLDTFQRNWRERGVLFFPHGGGSSWRFMKEAVEKGEFQTEMGCAFSLDALGMYALRGTGFVVINSNFYKIEDLDARNLSKFELHAQKMCYYVADFLSRKVPGFENASVAHVGVDLGVRASRRIRGRGVLKREAVTDAPGPTCVDDVIATAVVNDTNRESGEFYKPYTCDVPFSITVPVGCESLLVGSAKSVSTQPMAIIRGMTGCMICGQAAGAAAALAARTGRNVADLRIADLQKELLQQGVRLGTEERLKQLGLT